MTQEIKNEFKRIYSQNLWLSEESASGHGSELKTTVTIRHELPEVFKKFKIKSFLDIPCGDFNWLQHVDMTGIDYIGADIVDELIEKNKIEFPEFDFEVLDIIQSTLPKVDIIFTRDCLGHLSFDNAIKAIKNIRKSGSKYLLTTTFTAIAGNRNISDGHWYPINLMLSPFDLKAMYLINENCPEGRPRDREWISSKCLLLFEIDNFPAKYSITN